MIDWLNAEEGLDIKKLPPIDPTLNNP